MLFGEICSFIIVNILLVIKSPKHFQLTSRSECKGDGRIHVEAASQLVGRKICMMFGDYSFLFQNCLHEGKIGWSRKFYSLLCIEMSHFVGGSIAERSGDKLYNACCVFGTDGKLKAKHKKVLQV